MKPNLQKIFFEKLAAVFKGPMQHYSGVESSARAKGVSKVSASWAGNRAAKLRITRLNALRDANRRPIVSVPTHPKKRGLWPK